MSNSQSFGSSQSTLFTLRNSQGMVVTLTNFGARIVEVILPVSGEAPLNVSLSCPSDEAYLATDAYPGATIVPVAGRIATASSLIKGKRYQFTENEPGRTLHGGVNTANTQYWESEYDEDRNQVVFHLTLADGFNGFPGSVRVWATYRLTEENALEVIYEATAEKDTIFNPTNHVYFNLTGDFRQSVEGHQVRIAASRYAPLNEENLPTGELASVEGTPFDFQQGGTFAQGFDSEHPQNLLVKGYDHPWLLDKGTDAVRVTSPDGKIGVTVTTDQPAVVIYTYNFPEEKLADFHGAFSLECQALPNACNQEGFGSILLEKGEPFSSYTSYQFDWQD